VEEENLKKILRRFKEGQISEEDCLQQLRYWPFESLPFATIDHHRALRRGFPEVIFSEGKTPHQVAQIAQRIFQKETTVLATRANREVFDQVKQVLPEAIYYEQARVIVAKPKKAPAFVKEGRLLVITAGTSDIPVAEEAAITAEVMGARVNRLFDVGVAGIHRLLAHQQELEEAEVIIVAAGMEGALASVVGGMVDKPVIAVPTSVGYGTSFGGITALLSMLNSCASGVTVVNIDNGFGAGMAACLILRAIQRGKG